MIRMMGHTGNPVGRRSCSMGVRPLDHSCNLPRPVFMIVRLKPLVRNVDVIFSPCAIVGCVGEVFQEVVPTRTMRKLRATRKRDLAISHTS